MKKIYFLHDGNKHVGPYSIDDFKRFGIKRDTKVWFEGMPGWKNAEEIPELSKLFVPPLIEKKEEPVIITPPSLDQEQQEEQSIKPPIQSVIDPQLEKKKFPLVPVLIGAFVILAIIITLVIVNNSSGNSSSGNNNSSSSNSESVNDDSGNSDDARINERKNYIRDHYEDFYKVDVNYKYQGIGGIYDGTVTINNTSEYPIDAITIDVGIYLANGNLYRTKQVRFGKIPANSSDVGYFDCKDRGTSCQYSISYVKADYVNLLVN